MCRSRRDDLYYEPSVSDYVLLISHKLTATGAPIALLQMGKQLKASGKRPIFATPTDGPLRQAVLNAGIPLVVIPELYSSCFVSEIRTNFELVVVCTVVGIPAVVQLEGTSTQVLWWIHECELVYGWHFLKWMPRTLSENIYPVECRSFNGRYQSADRTSTQEKRCQRNSSNCMDK